MAELDAGRVSYAEGLSIEISERTCRNTDLKAMLLEE